MAVLFFLSEGYFASVNCRREVASAKAANKPLVLVHETDLRYVPGAPAQRGDWLATVHRLASFLFVVI
eukprot:3337445-Pleurochrysis_carterae.AAC.3